MTADELYYVNGGSGNENSSSENDSKDKCTYEAKFSVEGTVEFDENSGKPKGSVTAKGGYSVSGTK